MPHPSLRSKKLRDRAAQFAHYITHVLKDFSGRANYTDSQHLIPWVTLGQEHGDSAQSAGHFTNCIALTIELVDPLCQLSEADTLLRLALGVQAMHNLAQLFAIDFCLEHQPEWRMEQVVRRTATHRTRQIGAHGMQMMEQKIHLGCKDDRVTAAFVDRIHHRQQATLTEPFGLDPCPEQGDAGRRPVSARLAITNQVASA